MQIIIMPYTPEHFKQMTYLIAAQLSEKFPTDISCRATSGFIQPLRNNFRGRAQIGQIHKILHINGHCLEFDDDIETYAARCTQIGDRCPVLVRHDTTTFSVQHIRDKLTERRPIAVDHHICRTHPHSSELFNDSATEPSKVFGSAIRQEFIAVCAHQPFERMACNQEGDGIVLRRSQLVDCGTRISATCQTFAIDVGLTKECWLVAGHHIEIVQPRRGGSLVNLTPDQVMFAIDEKFIRIWLRWPQLRNSMRFGVELVTASVQTVKSFGNAMLIDALG